MGTAPNHMQESDLQSVMDDHPLFRAILDTKAGMRHVQASVA
jgi:hypothetical protein